MTDEPTPGHTLTAPQRTRVEYARRDLDAARSENLAELGSAGLILLVERLRHRLDDVLEVVDEISAPSKPIS